MPQPRPVAPRGRADGAIGLLVALALLALGLTILGFTGRSVALSLGSPSWPVVQGQVIRSGVADGRVQVSTQYTVDGVRYTTHRIGFDVFDQPGGTGRHGTLLARWPVGAQVPVHVRPGVPGHAVLETGAVYPFVMPGIFGAFFVAAGSGMAWSIARAAWGWAPLRARTVERLVLGMLATLFWVGFAVPLLDPAVQETFAQAVGPLLPLGAPLGLWLWLTAAIVAFPIPQGAWHLLILLASGVRGPVGLAAALRTPGPLRRSAILACGTGLWVFGWVAGWIAFAGWRGV